MILKSAKEAECRPVCWASKTYKVPGFVGYLLSLASVCVRGEKLDALVVAVTAGGVRPIEPLLANHSTLTMYEGW